MPGEILLGEDAPGNIVVPLSSVEDAGSAPSLYLEADFLVGVDPAG